MEPTEHEPAGAPGPFERGWKCLWEKQRPLVIQAQQKTLLHDGNAEAWSSPSLWNTKEMEMELEKARESYLEGEDSQDLEEYGRRSETAKRPLLNRNTPGHLQKSFQQLAFPGYT